MMFNINQIMNMYQRLTSNPQQILSSRFNIPANLNNPQDIVQHLLNSGQISQDQVNQAMKLKNNPMFSGLLK